MKKNDKRCKPVICLDDGGSIYKSAKEAFVQTGMSYAMFIKHVSERKPVADGNLYLYVYDLPFCVAEVSVRLSRGKRFENCVDDQREAMASSLAMLDICFT